MSNPISGATGHRRARPPAGWRLVAAGVAALWTATAAHAEICKYADTSRTDGVTLYSNVSPGPGWKRITCIAADDGSASTVTKGGGAGARGTPSPPGFPRVNSETQRGRDDVRKKVLGEELATEEKLLAEARTAYADGAPVPLPEEKADAEKYRVRIGKLRQAVNVHERNVEALKKEIAAVK